VVETPGHAEEHATDLAWLRQRLEEHARRVGSN
jgi:hypothetical protein